MNTSLSVTDWVNHLLSLCSEVLLFQYKVIQQPSIYVLSRMWCSLFGDTVLTQPYINSVDGCQNNTESEIALALCFAHPECHPAAHTLSCCLVAWMRLISLRWCIVLRTAVIALCWLSALLIKSCLSCEFHSGLWSIMLSFLLNFLTLQMLVSNEIIMRKKANKQMIVWM